MKSKKVALFLLFLGLVLPQGFVLAQSYEQLGHLQLKELLLRPDFVVKETQGGQFGLDAAFLGVEWKLDRQFLSYFSMGPRKLKNQMARFPIEHKQENNLDLVEAYAQFENIYGRWRMGLIPINFGVEGEIRESALYFPRSLIFQRRAMLLRDYGLSYSVIHQGWFTDLILHNGSSQASENGRLWYTGKWGWTDSRRFQTGFSAMTGNTRVDGNQWVEDNLGGVNSHKEALWRVAGVFADWRPSSFKINLEAYMGEVQQDQEIGKWAAGHVDLLYSFSRHWDLQLRYDSFDPNLRMDGDGEQELSLGVGWSNSTQTSRLYFIGTKVFREGNQRASDEFRILWNLTPLVPTRVGAHLRQNQEF